MRIVSFIGNADQEQENHSPSASGSVSLTEIGEQVEFLTLTRNSDHYFSLLKRYTPSIEQHDSDKSNGRFFTHPTIAQKMIDSMMPSLAFVKQQETSRIVDPFAGDGRLLAFLLERLAKDGCLPKKSLYVRLCDTDTSALSDIKKRLADIVADCPIELLVDVRCGDSFLDREIASFDVCITNPPWYILKPTQGIGDIKFDAQQKAEFNTALKAYQDSLRHLFPEVGSGSGFSSNCLNLSRCGLGKALQLVRPGGVCAIVMPATFFSDQISKAQRELLFANWNLLNLFYYPAECKLFGSVDQTSITFVAVKESIKQPRFEIRCFNKSLESASVICEKSKAEFLQSLGYAIPFGYSETQWDILAKFQGLPSLGKRPGVKFVRELDETRIDERLTDTGSIKFIKGFMVDRYSQEPPSPRFLKADAASRLPTSVNRPKIVWRDVSRESQTRRIKATILPSGYVAGNSLGVLYSETDDLRKLKYLLAVINSFVFEFQAKQHLITNHVPAGVLKKVSVPSKVDDTIMDQICAEAASALQGNAESEITLECLVAKAYGLTHTEFFEILMRFKIEDDVRQALGDTAMKILGSK